MTSKPYSILLLLALVALLIGACAAPVAPVSESAAGEPAPATAPAEEAPVNVVYDLPDLGGRAVAAAMANDYTPLQFIDPVTGAAVGWEYDAVARSAAGSTVWSSGTPPPGTP